MNVITLVARVPVPEDCDQHNGAGKMNLKQSPRRNKSITGFRCRIQFVSGQGTAGGFLSCKVTVRVDYAILYCWFGPKAETDSENSRPKLILKSGYHLEGKVSSPWDLPWLQPLESPQSTSI